MSADGISMRLAYVTVHGAINVPSDGDANSMSLLTINAPCKVDGMMDAKGGP